MLLLDTNVVSALRRRERCDPALLKWVERIDPADLFLSVITVLELEVGALSLARRDPSAGAVIRTWIDMQVLPSFEGRVLPVDTAVARRCAGLHVPDRRAERDALIAATALVHGLTVATRNTVDFEPLRVDLVNPWQPGS